ncbi:MAG: solute carrier family 23 protein [Alicyclobacillaceae bacterium]|nr:solute carrier family 23 protein [Alicyclobacillaceae bacterium]
MQRVVDVHERLPLGQALPLSLQHMFAMFGATVLVPFLTGLDPSVALFTGGLGTLLYILLTKGMIPAYLGSSFAFIAPILAVSKSQGQGEALFGAAMSGVVYIAVALLIGRFGTRWLERLLPPIVVGPVVVVIGLSLAGTAVSMASKHYGAALVSLSAALAAMVFFRGFLNVIPVLFGIAVGYAYSAAAGLVDWQAVVQAPWLAMPHFATPKPSSLAFWTVAPVALVTIAEHIGHLLVTENIVGRPLMRDPGLHRSLLGDGVATVAAGMVGGPPTTTYGENIGVMAITRVYSVWVIAGAAGLAMAFAFIGKLGALVRTIPEPVMGGISILLFGTIAAAGVRMLVEHRVDFGRPRNLAIASVIMVLGVGVVGDAVIRLGSLEIGGLALATFGGMLLNAVLPDRGNAAVGAGPDGPAGGRPVSGG